MFIRYTSGQQPPKCLGTGLSWLLVNYECQHINEKVQGTKKDEINEEVLGFCQLSQEQEKNTRIFQNPVQNDHRGVI